MEMCISKFLFMDKQKTQMYAETLFGILYSNMNIIAPSGNSYEEDFSRWCANVIPAMQKKQRQIVLMYVDDVLAGYFQYYINVDTRGLMMEEIQIKKEFQGSGLFSKFYQWLVQQLPKDILYVEAFANQMNDKSQKILVHLGLVKTQMGECGDLDYFKGQYADLLKRYR